MKWFVDKVTLRKALLFTVFFASMYTIINFTYYGVAGLLKITNGANILDFEFGYTADKAYNILTALGELGRSYYLSNIIPLDFLFPFSYMIFYAGWIALLIKNISITVTSRYIVVVPICAMIFDWIENTGIIIMLSTYPDIPAAAVYVASVSGILKTLFTYSSIIIIFVSLIIYLIKKLLRLKNNKHK
jgi:hypothetical protein